MVDSISSGAREGKRGSLAAKISAPSEDSWRNALDRAGRVAVFQAAA